MSVASLTFGQKLRELREAAGLTQSELADRAGLHFTWISKYETGVQEPYFQNLLRLCKALGVSLEAFEGCLSQRGG